MKIAAYLIEKIGSTVSGYFHPSLWLSESHELLVTQSHNRVDARGAPSRQEAGDHGDDHQGQECGTEGQRVSRTHFVKQISEQARQPKRSRRPQKDSARGQSEAPGNHQPEWL